MTVLTLTEPTLRAVPPIELKLVVSCFHMRPDYFLYPYGHTPISECVSIAFVLLLARIVSTGCDCIFPLCFLIG